MALEPEITIEKIGAECQPIAVIDNFCPDADTLRAVARTLTFSPARNLYPGIRAPLPDTYWCESQIDLCKRAIAEAFGHTGAISLIDSSFSMVTTRRDKLSIGQRLPHSDAFSPQHVALVHYLSRDFSEGTAFYRHRATGMQAITEFDRENYFQQIDEELRRLGPPPCDYIRGDTELFQQIGQVDGKFNRAVLYRGQQLHSGAIGPQTPLSADPAKGRLTVTAFITLDDR